MPKTLPIDGVAQYAISKSRNMLVPYYLMASYLYYVRDTSLLTDGYYDALCKQLDKDWDKVAHTHKHVIDRDWLKAGTCMLAREKYPSLTKAAACVMANLKLEVDDLPPKLVQHVATPKIRQRARPV